jgi:propanediol dehydratase small subunit
MTPPPAGEPVDPSRDPAPCVALSGKPLDEITLEAAVRGGLSATDLRIHPGTLRRQAAVAEQYGNPQLGENLRRAAELTAFADDEVLAIYEALRPGRSTLAELQALAARLEATTAPRCAAMVREAAEVYDRRGLLKST